MKSFDMTELKAMLNQIPDARQRVVVLMGFWHGLRATEMISIKGRDIRHGHVDVQRLKGSMHTVQRYQKHPDPELDEYTLLSELEPTIGDDEFLLPRIRTRFGILQLVKRASLRAGINPLKAHTHTLKHTAGMMTIGAGIEITRQRLGHKTIASTGAYLRVTDDRASDAIDKFLGI